VKLTVEAFPNHTFTGKIAVLDPQVMPDTRTIKLQAMIDNHEHLLMPGMFAHVEIVQPAKENVISVPETALDHNVYGDFLYVVREGDAGPDGKPQLKAVRTTVTLGERSYDRVEVTGLKAGDRVVTVGQMKLFDGAAVTLNTQPLLTTPQELPLH
jgi:multidrug efflux system membrane fusion protein